MLIRLFSFLLAHDQDSWLRYSQKPAASEITQSYLWLLHFGV